MVKTLFALKIADEASMVACGARLAHLLDAGDVVRLEGNLGAGKTVLARSIIQSLHPDEKDVPSPTFPLVQLYEGAEKPVWHFDLYRLEEPEEVWELGLEDALEAGITLVEWPDNAGSALPLAALTIEIELTGEVSRKLIFGTGANTHNSWLQRLSSINAHGRRVADV